MLISHVTTAGRALLILEQGFDIRMSALTIERGANFYATNDGLGNNDVHTGCTLNFQWHGRVNPGTPGPWAVNVLYDFGGWRKFIARCDSDELEFLSADLNLCTKFDYRMRLIDIIALRSREASVRRRMDKASGTRLRVA